jgi:hypothetical protein
MAEINDISEELEEGFEVTSEQVQEILWLVFPNEGAGGKERPDLSGKDLEEFCRQFLIYRPEETAENLGFVLQSLIDLRDKDHDESVFASSVDWMIAHLNPVKASDECEKPDWNLHKIHLFSSMNEAQAAAIYYWLHLAASWNEVFIAPPIQYLELDSGIEYWGKRAGILP